jgi:Raf kinase inhibitor-like YbhB/YbcL family protein
MAWPIFEVVMPFRLVSSAFKDGDFIPEEFTAYGKDISPKLSWSGHPVKTVSFALVMEDRDAKSDAIHWVLWNVPATIRSLPKDVGSGPVLADGTSQGRNDFNKVGYSGPRLARVTEHSYLFKLYALDSALNLKAGSNHNELMVQMRSQAGRILAETQLVGRFKPQRDHARVRALDNDKEFVMQSDEIKRRLKEAYNTRPQDVKRFFSGFSLPSAFGAREIREFMNTIGDDAVRRTLEDYLTFANRFRVQFRLRTSPLEFRTLLQPSYGNKFHVKIVDGHLEPGMPAPTVDNDSFVELFGADKLKILEEAQALVDKGQATFTQIDDGPEYSMLKDLESFAYKDDGIAFFIHNAEQRYLGCIFGEKSSKQLLHDMGKTLTEFQKKHFSRPPGGRPPDMAELKKMLAIDKKPISNVEKAAELAEGGDERKVKAQEVKLSKMRAKRRKSKG